jgi:general secretion pathway protein G
MSITRVEAALILGALAIAVGAVSLVSGSASASTEQGAAEEDAKRVLRAAEAWRSASETEGCPTLSVLEKEGQLPEEARTDDPWGERFRVVCDGEDTAVRSYGRDGKANTADDLVIAADG